MRKDRNITTGDCLTMIMVIVVVGTAVLIGFGKVLVALAALF